MLDCLMVIAAVSQGQKLAVKAFRDKYAFRVVERFWNNEQDDDNNKKRRGGMLDNVENLAAYLVAEEEALATVRCRIVCTNLCW